LKLSDLRAAGTAVLCALIGILWAGALLGHAGFVYTISGIKVLKYWFSITDDAQHVRFPSRIHDPMKQWKLSPMDLESRRRWE